MVSDLSGSNPFVDDRPTFNFPPEKANGEFEDRPYFGPRLDLKKEDPVKNLPRMRSKAHIHQFDLTNQEHMEKYESICQAIFDGNARLSFEERVYDADIKSWRVLIRWAEIYMGAPKNLEKKPGK